jgi:hypothetical protein
MRLHVEGKLLTRHSTWGLTWLKRSMPEEESKGLIDKGTNYFSDAEFCGHMAQLNSISSWTSKVRSRSFLDAFFG